MSPQLLPAISRYALIVACVAALGAIIAGVFSHRTTEKTDAMARASQECQQDLKTQITQLQDYVAAKKAVQAAGEQRGPDGTALQEKMKAIQALKSRC